MDLPRIIFFTSSFPLQSSTKSSHFSKRMTSCWPVICSELAMRLAYGSFLIHINYFWNLGREERLLASIGCQKRKGSTIYKRRLAPSSAGVSAGASAVVSAGASAAVSSVEVGAAAGTSASVAPRRPSYSIVHGLLSSNLNVASLEVL